MKINEIEHKHAGKLIEKLASVSNARRLYRGHADKAWRLIPSAYRNDCSRTLPEDETSYHNIAKKKYRQVNADVDKRLRLFYRTCIERGFPVPDLGRRSHSRLMGYSAPMSRNAFLSRVGPLPQYDDWPILALMQHYGFKTQLLDWSLNPLVALFFAVDDCPDKDGCVWEFEQSLIDQMPAFTNVDWPGHTGGIRSNFSNTTDCAIFLEKPLSIGNDRIIPQAGLLSVSIYNFENEMRDEKEEFLDVCDYFDFLNLYKRIYRHMSNSKAENLNTSASVTKHIVDSRIKSEVKEALEVIKIDKISVYPEVAGLRDFVEERVQ